MRLFAAAIISVGLLGGLSAYMHVKAQWRTAAPAYEPPAAAGIYSLEVTPSFSTEHNPFALDIGDGSNADTASLSVSLGERILLSKSGPIAAGEIVRVEAIDGIVVGKNELLVKVSVPLNKLSRSHAVRIRILRDGIQVADTTLWSEPRQPVSGVVTLEVAAAEEIEESHDHD